MLSNPLKSRVQPLVLDDRALANPGVLLGVSMVRKLATRMPDHDRSIFVLVDRNRVPPQTSILFGVLDHVEDLVVSQRQVLAQLSFVLQRQDFIEVLTYRAMRVVRVARRSREPPIVVFSELSEVGLARSLQMPRNRSSLTSRS